MSSMILCPSCKRHVFARESSCPFCAIALSGDARRPSPEPPAKDLSRAQRYVVGAAIAATFATAACSSPTVVHDADHVHVVNVDPPPPPPDGKSSSGGGNGNRLEVAGDPDELEAERQRELERRRQEELERQRDLEEDRWHRRGGSCQNGVCPPYGCVFPDEACDILRV